MIEFDSNPLKKYLHQILKRSRADMELRFAKEKMAITPFQYKILHSIKEQSLTINDIARQCTMKAPSLVPAVDILESQGLLERKDNATDRRKIQLLIKKKGLELLARVPFDDKDDTLNTAFGKLSAVKQKQLLTTLQELINNFT